MKHYLISPEQMQLLQQTSGFVCKMFIEWADGTKRLSKHAIVELENIGDQSFEFRTALNLPLSPRFRFIFQMVAHDSIVQFSGELLEKQCYGDYYKYHVDLVITEKDRSLLYYTMNELLKHSDPILSKKLNSYSYDPAYPYFRPQIDFLT